MCVVLFSSNGSEMCVVLFPSNGSEMCVVLFLVARVKDCATRTYIPSSILTRIHLTGIRCRLSCASATSALMAVHTHSK